MQKISLYDLRRKLRTSQDPDEIITYLRFNLAFFTQLELSALLCDLLEYQEIFFEAAELLITEGGADIHYKKEDIIPIIFCAIGANKPQAVQYALTKGARLVVDSPDYLFAVAYIFKHYRLSAITDMLLILIEHNIHFNFVLDSLDTPLLLATRHNNNHEVVQFLLGEEVNKYVYDEDGFTAIHYVPFAKAPNLYKIMITCMADIQVRPRFATSMEPVFECVIRVNEQHTFEEFIYEALNAFLENRHRMYDDIFEKYYYRLHLIAEHISRIRANAGHLP
ncbi:ankyrin repeat domain-containing protein [Chitinophaga nivalis]|uniref:Ankyrin repeat domain-containing protein n=1 Tax=Chitinophaga nivalis TaxID=2991709 RepID=A0ABT3INY5_9BACT|nr:ankyrin repeat domain-containing protein [Chitinophaga nivalis]MCW3464617.1 ankyrin repeat domain-containing protein [Chitinophaga nivalis]MCW3485692.1 ankyrin repeat domain-containing protein [Chitinophaga nivalis]